MYSADDGLVKALVWPSAIENGLAELQSTNGHDFEGTMAKSVRLDYRPSAGSVLALLVRLGRTIRERMR